jgi:hypothetical protein
MHYTSVLAPQGFTYGCDATFICVRSARFLSVLLLGLGRGCLGGWRCTTCALERCLVCLVLWLGVAVCGHRLGMVLTTFKAHACSAKTNLSLPAVLPRRSQSLNTNRELGYPLNASAHMKYRQTFLTARAHHTLIFLCPSADPQQQTGAQPRPLTQDNHKHARP